jgi:hypothetical protein
MIALRRLAIWMSVVFAVSVFALAPVLVGAQGTLPAGDYTTSSTLAGFNYFTPDFATGLSVFVQVETKVSDPRDGSPSSSHTESVNIEYFRDGFGFQGCYNLAPGQFSIDSRLGGASLDASITSDTPTCGSAEIGTPFQLDMTLTRFGPVRTTRRLMDSSCLDYRLEATYVERITGANATASLTPIFAEPISANDAGVLRITDETTHVQGTVHESCPEQPGAIAGGAGPPDPGVYRNSRSDASISRFEESGEFGLDLEETTYESRPVGGPATIDHRMQVRFTIRTADFTFAFGCFLLSPSDFSFDGVNGAEVNAIFTEETPTCFGEPAGIPLPQTLHVLWTTTTPVSTFRSEGSFDCLTYHQSGQTLEAASHPEATASLTPYLSDPVTASGSQTSLVSSESRSEAAGKKQPECRI